MQADGRSAEGHHNTEQLGDKVKDKFHESNASGRKTCYLYVHRMYTFPVMDSK